MLDETLPETATSANGRGAAALKIALAGFVGLGLAGGLTLSGKLPNMKSARSSLAPVAMPQPEVLPPLAQEHVDLLRTALVDSVLKPAPPLPVAEVDPVVETPAVLAERDPSQTFAALAEPPPTATEEPSPAPDQAVAGPARLVPLPMPRPAEFRAASPRALDRVTRRRVASAAPTAPMEDTRNFFEKLLGVEQQQQAPVLAYASLEPPTATAPRVPMTAAPPRPAAPSPAAGGGTAIYNISARTVTLPNGEVLEAHSGLGKHQDSPDGVHVRMSGATPPGTYELTEREALFHGVRAIRLNPVGGPGAIYNRAGLLAHTYMLGASGASNGCISFKNYNRFLQAFLSGQVQRVVVVAGSRGDAVPNLVRRIFGGSQQTADAGG